MKYAVIDIGTNSTRLYVAEVGESLNQSKITKLLATTRLGEGIGSSNAMGEAPMARTSDAVADFVFKAKELGVKDGNIFIYATAMVREASNKSAFAQTVKNKTGIDLEIIPGELEGQIAYMGAVGNLNGYGVIDIGGGSTEVVTNEGSLLAYSAKIGAVRLKEKFFSANGTVNVASVKEFVFNNYLAVFGEKTQIAFCKGLIGVSGTPTTIASLSLGLKTYEPEKIQNLVYSKADLDVQLDILARQTLSERIAYSGEFAPRADVIVYGGCILSAFMDCYGFDKLLISDRDSLEGFLDYKLKR